MEAGITSPNMCHRLHKTWGINPSVREGYLLVVIIVINVPCSWRSVGAAEAVSWHGLFKPRLDNSETSAKLSCRPGNFIGLSVWSLIRLTYFQKKVVLPWYIHVMSSHHMFGHMPWHFRWILPGHSRCTFIWGSSSETGVTSSGVPLGTHILSDRCCIPTHLAIPCHEM